MSYLKNVDMYKVLRFRELKLFELVFLKCEMSIVIQSFVNLKFHQNLLLVSVLNIEYSVIAVNISCYAGRSCQFKSWKSCAHPCIF